MRRWFHDTSLSTCLLAGLAATTFAGAAQAADAANVDEVIVNSPKAR